MPGTKMEPLRRKLVYVEDNADARTAMGELLRILEYEVVEVALGADALPAVASALPDAVVVDIGLPDIDGYAVARQLRGHPAGASIAIIALTGYGQHNDMQDAARAGFDAHLVKPVDIYHLTQTIEDILERKSKS